MKVFHFLIWGAGYAIITDNAVKFCKRCRHWKHCRTAYLRRCGNAEDWEEQSETQEDGDN